MLVSIHTCTNLPNLHTLHAHTKTRISVTYAKIQTRQSLLLELSPYNPQILLFTLQEAEIKKMAKSGNKEACKILAKQLVQLRKQKNRTYAVSSKVTSMSTQTKVMNSQMKMAGAMSTTAKVRFGPCPSVMVQGPNSC